MRKTEKAPAASTEDISTQSGINATDIVVAVKPKHTRMYIYIYYYYYNYTANMRWYHNI